MRVHVVDPAAYTPPYDHALCGALATHGLTTTLVTTRFAHGDVPPAAGYQVSERFYRGSSRLPGRARQAARLARHVPDMLAYKREAEREADVVHFQWLPVQALDGKLLPDKPLVITAHDVLPRERARAATAQKQLYDRADAVVVHSAHGRTRLLGLGIPEHKVHVIAHGVLDRLTTLVPQQPPELPAPQRPVVLFFGLIRPYKGLDLLVDAWRRLDVDAELWVVGQPRSKPPLLPTGTRTALRFVSDAEAAWCFRHADVVALPYREIDQSGVLFTALAFERPLVLADVGGFPEVGAALHVPANDARALTAALDRLLSSREERSKLSAAARRAAATTYAWPRIAGQHAELYERLTAK